MVCRLNLHQQVKEFHIMNPGEQLTDMENLWQKTN